MSDYYDYQEIVKYETKCKLASPIQKPRLSKRKTLCKNNIFSVKN